MHELQLQHRVEREVHGHLRRMPEQVRLGQSLATTMASPMTNRQHWYEEGCPNPHGLRVVMGYFLPEWQRPLVWTTDQQMAFMRSAWLGLPLGTYSLNLHHAGGPLDNLLVDGQQRMNAIEQYMLDQFPVFGWHWSECTEVDRRFFDMSVAFPSYRTETNDEAYLRSYYDLMNFGGTAHTEGQRATLQPRD